MTALCIALRLTATKSPLCAEAAAQLPRIAAAITTQLYRDICPVWGGTGTGVRALAPGELPGAGESLFDIVDTFPADLSAAEAYHTEAAGKPVLEDALDDARTLADFSTSASHEAGETAADPGVNREAISFTTGWAYALEIHDPFENNSYAIRIGDGGPDIVVSDFALPSWFDDQGVAPFSYCEAMRLPGARAAAPFQVPAGGYCERRQVTTSQVEVDGRMVTVRTYGPREMVGTPSARRARRIARAASRVSRRGAR